MANQIIEQQIEAQIEQAEQQPLQFIVAEEEWDWAGECCVSPAQLQAEAAAPPILASEEKDWGWGRCAA